MADDDDWDTAAEAAADVAVPTSRWAGEDEEEQQHTQDSWDAATADTQSNTQEKKQGTGVAAGKPNTRPVLSERKKKQLAEAEKKQKEKEVEDSDSDPKLVAARKAELESQTRSRDARLAAQLLGVEIDDDNNTHTTAVPQRDNHSDIAEGAGTLSGEEQQQVKNKGARSLEDYKVDDDTQMDALAAAIVNKCIAIPSTAKHSTRLLRFLKTLTNGICDPMRVDDVAELKRSVTAKHNEVTQKQKTANKGKKAATVVSSTKKATTVKLGSTGIGSSVARNSYADEIDEYDDDDDDDTGGFM